MPKYAWYKDLSRYQWFVLAVYCIGWMFDTMAHQIFNLARKSAIHDLMGAQATDSMGVPVPLAAWVLQLPGPSPPLLP